MQAFDFAIYLAPAPKFFSQQGSESSSLGAGGSQVIETLTSESVTTTE